MVNQCDPDYRYDYDSLGRLTLVVGPDGIMHHAEYDTNGNYPRHRVKRTWQQTGASTFGKVEYEYYGDAHAYHPYLLRKVKQYEDASTVRTVRIYDYTDEENYVSSVTLKNGDETSTLEETTFSYTSEDEDHQGHGVPTEVTVYAHEDSETRTTEFVYDAFNRGIKMIGPKATTTAKQYMTTWSYCSGGVTETCAFYGDDGSGWDAISKTKFIYDPSASWLNEVWEYKNPNNTGDAGAADRITKYTYYDTGLQKCVTNPRAYSTTYIYDSLGRTQTVRHYKDESNFDSVSYTYAPDGKMLTETNECGEVTTYVYDDCNRQWKVQQNTGSEVIETAYGYQGSSRLTTSVTNPEGEVTSYVYDSYARRQKEIVDPDGLAITTTYTYDDYTGEVLSVQDPIGTVTEYAYDVLGRVTVTTYAADTSDETAVSNTYDNAGAVETVTTALGTTTYEYDELDREISVEDALENETTFEYDDFTFDGSDPYVRRCDSREDALENVTLSFYDVYGRLDEVRHVTDGGNISATFEYDANGNETVTTDANGVKTAYAYDHRDRVTQTVYAAETSDEATVTRTLDAAGRVTKETDANGKETEYEYDDAGRLVKTTFADDSVVVLTFDKAGRTTTYKDQEGRETGYAYDTAGRLTVTTYPDGNTVALTRNALGGVTTRTDQEGNETDYTYTVRGWPSQVTYADETTVDYTYDDVGNLTELEDQKDQATEYGYDTVGRLVVTTYPDTTTEALTRDALGRVSTRKRRSGAETDYYYDELTRMTTVVYPDDSVTSYTYDNVSRVLTARVEDPSETQLSRITWVYDNLGRTTSETQQVGSECYGTTYTYDDVGNLTGLEYNGPSGSRTSLTMTHDDVYNVTAIKEGETPIAGYTVDKLGRPTKLVLENDTYVEYSYDDAGHLSSLVNWNPNHRKISSYGFTRDKVGNPTEIAYHDGRRREFTYDDIYQLTQELHLGVYETELARHDYTYDDAGNRLTKKYDDNAGKTLTYTYDVSGLNQLTDLTGTPGGKVNVAGTLFDDQITSAAVRNIDTGSFTKAHIRDDVFIARAIELQSGDNDIEAIAEDRAGNRSVDPSTGDYTVTLDNSPDYDYEYDTNGCLDEITDDSAAVTTYAYDYENRLVEVGDAVGETTLAAFTYDAIGRRITCTNAEGDTTTFVYAGQDVVQEYDGAANTLRREYVYGVGVDNVLRVDYHDQTTTSCYYHHDWLGSVTELTDDDGKIVAWYEYDAWGNVVTEWEASGVENEFRFSTKQWDATPAGPPDQGLIYFGARYLAPALGRWTQRDPIGIRGGFNAYAYGNLDPINALDPWGLKSWCKLDVEMLFFGRLFPHIAPSSEVGQNLIAAVHLLYGFLGTVENVMDYTGNDTWFAGRDAYFDWFEKTVDQVRLEHTETSHTSNHVITRDGSSEPGRAIVLDIDHYTEMGTSDTAYLLMVAVDNIFHETMHLACDEDEFDDGNVPHTADPHAYTDPSNDKPGFYNAWFREWRNRVATWVGKRLGVSDDNIEGYGGDR